MISNWYLKMVIKLYIWAQDSYEVERNNIDILVFSWTFILSSIFVSISEDEELLLEKQCHS